MKSKKLKPKYGSFEYAFPDDQTLKEVRDRFTYPEGDISDIVTPTNASEIDLFKIKICHYIDGYRIEHQLKKKEVAKLLEIDESRMSEMMNGKLESYSIERLYGYLKKLNPEYSLTLSIKNIDK